jgi:hypothetical protein
LVKPAGGSKLLGYTPLPSRRCIHVHLYILALSLALALSVTNTLWLYHSQDIGDLPCRKCHYMSCAPLPLFKQYCDPCYYISEAYTSWTSDGTLDIDLHCPYGEIAHFVTTNVPTQRDDWVSFCHEYCVH